MGRCLGIGSVTEVSIVDMVCLSLDGKILMETYDGVMEFFTSLIREKLAGFQLRDAFKVNLVG